MALLIGIVSQKGGVGKSTLARLLAREYAASDWSVKIADMDTQQGTCTHWASRRLQADRKPEIPVEQFNRLDRVLRQADHYDIIIFDGAPHATNITRDIAKYSNLVILPTGYSLDDLLPTVKLAHELKREGVPSSKIAIAFSRVGDSEAEAQEAARYVEESGYFLLPGSIPERTAYRRASDLGMALTETSFSSLSKKADELVSAIVRRMEVLEKQEEVSYA